MTVLLGVLQTVIGTIVGNLIRMGITLPEHRCIAVAAMYCCVQISLWNLVCIIIRPGTLNVHS